MKINLSLIALPAALLVSACNNDNPEVIDRTPQDPMADQLGNATPVELPPMVKQSETFRCKDNSLIFVDYMSDDKTVHLRIDKKEGAPVILKAEEPGQPFTAEGGYSITGPADTITASLPGKGSQSCKS
tara:strand:- start:23343 stop:23729 length:387 start_codon:yes stop_codon:yes gene_type:complete